MRTAAMACAGLAAFVLGATYLSLGGAPALTTFTVVGLTEAVPGEPMAVRVRGRRTEGDPAFGRSKTVPVTVHGALLDGDAVSARTQDGPGGGTTLVELEVPTTLTGRGEAMLTLDVEGGGRRDLLDVPLRMRADTPELRAAPTPKRMPDTSRPHVVDVLPEAGVLPSGMETEVFVWVRDPSGSPVADATVTVAHSTLEGGRVRLTTNGAGVASFELDASQPSFRLALAVDSVLGRHDEELMLRPRGRGMLLSTPRHVVPPGVSRPVTLRAWKDMDVYCDVVVHGTVRAGFVFDTKDATAELEVPGLPAGVHQLQCYDHPVAPDERFAVLPLVVQPDAGDALGDLRQAVRDEGHVVTASLPDVRVSGAEAAGLTGRFLLAMLRGPLQGPELLLATRGEDVAAEKARYDAVKGRILGALAVLLAVALLFVLDTILRGAVRTRRRMHAAAEELLDDLAEDLDRLDDHAHAEALAGIRRLERTRGSLMGVILLVTLVLNIVGLLALFALIR